MPALPSNEIIAKMKMQKNIWIATVRPDLRPHLAPVWFVWYNDRIYIGTDPKSVKVGNLQNSPKAAWALEDGTHPIIGEGTAKRIETPWPEELLAAFMDKYEWNLNNEQQFNDIWEFTPLKWLSW